MALVTPVVCDPRDPNPHPFPPLLPLSPEAWLDLRVGEREIMKAKDWDKDEEGEDGKTREPENRTAREGDRHHRGKSEEARDSEGCRPGAGTEGAGTERAGGGAIC